MKYRIKPLLAIVLATGMYSSAQAAYLKYVDHLGTGGYSAATNGALVDDAVLDLSSPPAEVTLFGANLYTTPLVNGSLEHSYAADTFLGFSTFTTDLSLSLSHSLSAMATGPLTVGSHQQDVFVDLTAVTLRIAGQAGEAPGSAVLVSFRGDASALHDFSGLVNGAYLGLGLSVSRGNTVVGEYLWDVQQTGDESVGFSFGANVGDEYTLSAYMLSGGGLSGAEFVPSGPTPFALIDSGASLNGRFSVTAVPEPGTFALILAGLGMLGLQKRRRNTATR